MKRDQLRVMKSKSRTMKQRSIRLSSLDCRQRKQSSLHAYLCYVNRPYHIHKRQIAMSLLIKWESACKALRSFSPTQKYRASSTLQDSIRVQFKHQSRIKFWCKTWHKIKIRAPQETFWRAMMSTTLTLSLRARSSCCQAVSSTRPLTTWCRKLLTHLQLSKVLLRKRFWQDEVTRLNWPLRLRL